MSDIQRKTILWFACVVIAASGLVFISKAQAQSLPPDELIVEGAMLYEQNCFMCHGAEGEGRVGATLSKDWPSIRPDLTVRTIISSGVPGSVMPAWSQANGGPLSENQIDALVAYILSWQNYPAGQILAIPTATLRAPITPIPQVQGDPNRGAVLFDQNCAVCHGAEGEGRVGASLAKDWPAIRPDLSVKNTIQNGVPGSVMPAWGQAKGGPLTETDINNLTAFILTLQDSERPLPPESVEPIQPPSALRGWPGVLIFILLLAIVLVFAYWIQRKKP
jgi:mono/diheme cytochrome c family protein